MIDFFQTLNIRRFVFSDGDNVNNPKVFIDFLQKKNYLNLETQIICFLGANRNQNTWYNTATKYIQSLRKTSSSINITPIRIRTEAANALDMVLTAYVGLAMAQNAASEFVIVSADKGYDSVVEHFSSLGIAIRRESVKDEKKLESSADKAAAKEAEARKRQFDEQVAEILLRFEKHDKSKMPRSRDALKNFLLVSFKKIIDESNVDGFADALIAALKKKGMVEASGQKITWV